MRLPSLTVPRTGETIHSTISRHLARHAGGTTGQFRILKLMHSNAHGFIPSGSLGLPDIAPRGHPWHNDHRRLIYENTLIPLFTSYFRYDKRAEVVNNVVHGTGNYARALIGTVPSDGLQTNNYKFCRLCLLADLESGVPVSYLEHQPSFVRVCATHYEPLTNGCVACLQSPRRMSRWVMAGTCNCNNA